jgi:hypothetical protein
MEPEALERRTFLCPAPASAPVMSATNLTTPTACAEEDNVNVPLSLARPVRRFSFSIEARHPGYDIGQDSRDADFTHCPPPPLPAAPGAAPETVPIYDDHVATAIVGVRDPNFHRPGMLVSAGGAPATGVHFIRVIRRIAGTDFWPEVLVLYSDGNLRLKPQAPAAGGDRAFGGDPVFGSSVVVGPAPQSQRPVADIRWVRYSPAKQTLHVRYAARGARADLRLARADRFVTRVRVTARHPAGPAVPFATLRSMFVADGNNDVDSVAWAESGGAVRQETVGAFRAATGSAFAFLRALRSRHNTSAPDVWIGDLKHCRR